MDCVVIVLNELAMIMDVFGGSCTLREESIVLLSKGDRFARSNIIKLVADAKATDSKDIGSPLKKGAIAPSWVW
jgi:hypothetical protein